MSKICAVGAVAQMRYIYGMANTDSAPTAHRHKRLYLVDGSGYIFRAFHALPPMTRPDGTPVNAVYGFCNMIQKLLDSLENDDAVAVIFDKSGHTFRNEIYDQYKANRSETPEDLVPQFPIFREATRAFNLPCVEQTGFEADDLIATYAHQARGTREVVIVSSDKDLMQLVGPGVTMLDPMKNNAVIAEPEVEKRFGVGPEKVIDVQALAGDSVDNVPGVPGIGVKTAALLINEYGDLETLLARAEEIKQPKRRQNLIEFAEQARLSRVLVELRKDVPVEEALDTFGRRAFDPDLLGAFLEKQNFKGILQRFRTRWFRDGLIDEHPTQAAVKPKDQRFELVSDVGVLEQWLGEVARLGRTALAVQTTRPGDHNMRARLAGIALWTEAGQACYVPVGHLPPQKQGDLALGDVVAPELSQITEPEVLYAIKALVEDPAVLKIGHNIKRDMIILGHECARHLPEEPPLAPRALDDVMLLSFVLDGGRFNHELRQLASRHCELDLADVKSLIGTGKSQIAFAEVALDLALDYAASVVDGIGRLHEILKPRLATEHMATVYETVERPLVALLARMEAAGVLVDRAELERLSENFAGRMATFVTRAHALAGEDFNIGSPKQLGEILFDKMSLSGGKKGKSGAYATGADILEDLAASGHDLPRVVLDWRQLSKLKSTYTDALVEQIHPDTGRVHTDYAMAVAQTGRLSSNDPNLQNIPVRTEEGRKIRRAFIAPQGHKLVSLDYSQIELRVVAHVARIAPLIEAFKQGQDIHAITASQVFGVPIEEMDAATRRRAKAINFGIIYGISAFGLARNLGIARSEAKAYIDAYFERYPGIRTYMDVTIEGAREVGYVTTLFGRRIHLAGIHDRNPSHRSFAERQAINAPIQGTAADIIKRAMIRVPAAMAAAKLDAAMLLQVHDELLFEVPDDQVEATIVTVRGVMENATKPVLVLDVPLVADAGVGPTWDDAH
ncbi:MAG: DNA polymerase I [Alphaproteobacteria bacterium]